VCDCLNVFWVVTWLQLDLIASTSQVISWEDQVSCTSQAIGCEDRLLNEL